MNYEKALGIAISEYLSEWDDGMTNDQILEAVREESDSVIIWEPFEDYTGETVAGYIEDTALSFFNASQRDK